MKPDTPHRLFMAMALTQDKISNIAGATDEQSYSKEWLMEKKGRTTANQIYAICTHCNQWGNAKTTEKF